MKFTCTKENLLAALTLAAPLTGKHANLPILSHILLTVSDSKVELNATNLEVAIRTTIRAKVDGAGAFTVPAKTFLDYISLLRDGQVDIELVENELLVRGGSSRTKIKGASSDEFPIIPPIEEDHGFVVDVEHMKRALSKTAIAVAKNEIRPELSGVYVGLFTDRYKGLVFAATDSYRLAETRMPVLQGGDEVRCIIPARAAYEIHRLLSAVHADQGETQVRIWASQNQFAIRYNGFEMTTRLIDGKYPDYVVIIPTVFKTTAAFPKAVMINSIKAAGIFAAGGMNAVSFDVNVENKTIGVSSTSTQMGEHSSEVDAEAGGQENSVLLNHRYVLEGLQHMDTDTIELKMNGSDTPCVFEEKDRTEYLYIVMPIRQ